MAFIGTRVFRGEIPRLEPHLLPPAHAQLAVDCDFANGSLKPINGGLVLGTMANSPIRGIYTDDGLQFYTWTSEAQSFKSPVIDDIYNRVYFLLPSQGTFRVTDKDAARPGGPTPPASLTFNVGVPRPETAPILTVIDNSSVAGAPIMPDYPSYSVSLEAWWEDSSGKSFNKSTPSATEVKPLEIYHFTPPVEPEREEPVEGEAAANVVYRLVARIVVLNTANGNEIMTATIRAGSSARSQALPGGIEFTLEQLPNFSVINLRWGVAETRAYTYTNVNTWAEESAPSPPNTVSVTYIQTVSIEATPTVFTGYRPFAFHKVYRTFGSSANYVQADVVATSLHKGYEKSPKPAIGGSTLRSTNWTPPPTGLQGIDLSANGWFVAFKGNTLYMSEPFRPHAWPYNMTFPRNIRGLKVAQQSIVVTTADGVYVVAGAHPSAAQQVKLSSPQAGIAQRSMANIDGAVAYASNDGFILVEGTSASPDVSQKLFDRRTWRRMFGTQLSDASMQLAYHDGALVGVSSNASLPATEAKGFLLRMDDDAGSFTRLSETYDSMFQLPVTDALYYSKGSAIFQFRGGTPGIFDWWTGDYIFPADVTFAIGFLNASDPVRFRIYSNDAVVFDMVVPPGHFRLPSMTKRLKWSVRLTGTSIVREFAIAGSITELKRE